MEPNKQATADKLLTDWTENTFFAPDTAEWALNANGTASLFAGAFVSTSAISADAPADWSSWSYLQIEVFNPSSDAQPFSVELRDTATVDYWQVHTQSFLDKSSAGMSFDQSSAGVSF